MTWNTSEPLGECFGITVRTTRTDLRATAHWIPGRVSPLDPSMVAHIYRFHQESGDRTQITLTEFTGFPRQAAVPEVAAMIANQVFSSDVG